MQTIAKTFAFPKIDKRNGATTVKMIQRKENITLKELAADLNLSVSTVSRALNNHPDISPATKKRVQDLAKELNYVPNLFAKGFRTHHTRILGVIVPNVSHYFTTTILKGILDEGEKREYRIIICESKNDEKKQSDMLQTILQFGAEGILLALARKTKSINEILKTMQRIPIVLFDKVSDKIPCTQVVIDEEVAAYTAVEHLINTGKRRIAIIKETENSYNSEKRFAGYLRALGDYNLPLDDKIVLSTEDISLEKGTAMANILLSLSHRPDAVFAITDSSAIGVIQALNRFNVKIPQEIAVVGFSNSINSTIISPSLSTIDQPGEKIGRTALKYLIDEISNPNLDMFSKTIEIKTSLIVRDSSYLP